jgi:hypothetical protein
VSSNPDAATRYERYALIFDPGHSRLGTEALGLALRGIDPLFTSDPDEAHLLALQETGRVGALIVPGTLPLTLLDLLIDRISPQLWAGAASVVVVDPPADRALLRALRDRELSWVLREPYDAAEFRFVVAAALAADDKLDPRSGLRVPISMPVVVTTGGDRRDGFVRNVSIGGVYIAIDAPPDAGTRIGVALAIGDRPLEVAADVAYSQATGAAGRAVRESGMGVAFRGLDDAQCATIAAFIGERIRSFRL